MMFVIHWNKFI